MQPDNLLHERQSQSHAAHCAAARLIHAEKRLKDAVPVLLGNARTGIPHADCRLTAFLLDRHFHRAARAVVLDRVLCQIEQQPVQQHITADKLHVFACLRQCNTVFLCQRRQIDQHFLGHRRKVDAVRARHGLQIAHFQQRAYKGAQPLELFLLKVQQRGCFGIHLRMLRRKKLEPCLYERQRRAKLVRRIAGELPLRVK